jgi:signal transduction histidine kinase
VVTLKIDSEKPIGQVIIHAKPMILNQVNRLDVFPTDFDDEVVTIIPSVMMAPLITGGKTIGLIMVERRVANAFDESDLETLEILAVQVASAIEHARLLQKTREIAIVEERTRLARDMHDGVAQNLAYLLIQVDRCLNMVEEGGKLEKQLEQISGLLKQNIEELRRNIFDLRPVDLEGKSIFLVLKNFVTEFGRRWNLKTTCLIEGDAVEVSPEVESSLYRILQETLSNARQHAQCTQLAVKVTVRQNEVVTLEVQDNGRGFNMEQVAQNLGQALAGQRQNAAFTGAGLEAAAQTRARERRRGLGLISMRERATRVGGQILIESNHQGTRVVAELPLRTGALNSN